MARLRDQAAGVLAGDVEVPDGWHWPDPAADPARAVQVARFGAARVRSFVWQMAAMAPDSPWRRGDAGPPRYTWHLTGAPVPDDVLGAKLRARARWKAAGCPPPWEWPGAAPAGRR